MKIKIAKYTNVVRFKKKPTEFHPMFKVSFDMDPAKLFKTDYFRITEVVHDSIYAILPSYREDEPGRFKIIKVDTPLAYPYFTSFNDRGISEKIKDIVDFGNIDTITEVTDTGIQFMIPDPELRSKPRPKTQGDQKITTKVEYHKFDQNSLSKGNQNSISKSDKIVEQLRIDFKATLDQLNLIAAKLDNVDVKIYFRVENNVVKASAISDI